MADEKKPVHEDTGLVEAVPEVGALSLGYEDGRPILTGSGGKRSRGRSWSGTTRASWSPPTRLARRRRPLGPSVARRPPRTSSLGWSTCGDERPSAVDRASSSSGDETSRLRAVAKSTEKGAP